MNKLKLISAVILAFIGLNLVFAGQPLTTTDNLANILIEKLNVDVQLTDSQKTIILKRLQKQITKVVEADKLNDSGQKRNNKKIANEEYQNFLDSILTISQRAQMDQKYESRKNTSK
jgi:hypothetical protein